MNRKGCFPPIMKVGKGRGGGGMSAALREESFEYIKAAERIRTKTILDEELFFRTISTSIAVGFLPFNIMRVFCRSVL
ncbi:MAG: hypothetical protein CVU64_13660 [Deltaproteobacteria bacterium HGW-Deltaproteobacteria-21]|nr:MAG: hypothetical protein CVU64_13660 [Deltaproteobacteria bacterium HGW-Deltaproteobacteria-21]